MKKMVLILGIMLIAALFSGPVLAKEPAHTEEQEKAFEPWERFNLNLGAFFLDLNSDVRVGLEGLGVGIEVDVEDALGLDSSTSIFFGNGFYRFGSSRRHRVDFGYTAVHRDATKVLAQDLPILGDIIPAGTTVGTKLDFDVIQVGYSYSFFMDDRMDFGVGIGFFVMPFEFEITPSGAVSKTEDFVAPLPTLALHGDFAITPKLFFKLKFNFLYLEIDDFKGSITAAALALEYNVWKPVGFGLGYTSFRTVIEANGEDYPGIDFVGNVEFEYQGLNLYAKFYF